jgi:N-acetylglucosaminyldiphosphoundecaprenol N-acetyl-beta-D-mannosaminyltransferase
VIAVMAHLAPAWATAPWAAGLAAIVAFVVIGLRAAGAPASTWLALAQAPVFLAWKAVTYLKLARGFDAGLWERTDRSGEAVTEVARVDVAGVPIDTVDMRTAVERVCGAIGGSRLFHVSTVNLDFVVRAQTDADVRRIFQRGDLNIADGAPVVWLSRILGANVPERVAGADLVPAIIARAAETGARVFLLGGEGGVVDVAAARMKQQHPELVIAGTFEPPRARVEDMDNQAILAMVKEARPDVLLVALGHPKQERWIDLHRDELPPMVAIGVGCVLDLIAGKSHRAPGWMQRLGLEWFYRLTREPRRLVGRYATDAAWLVPITLRAVGSRLSTRPAVEAA